MHSIHDTGLQYQKLPFLKKMSPECYSVASDQSSAVQRSLAALTGISPRLPFPSHKALLTRLQGTTLQARYESGTHMSNRLAVLQKGKIQL